MKRMCLDSGHKKLEKSNVVQSGWKTFVGSYGSNNLQFESVDYKGSRKVPLDKWITAEGDKIKSGTFGSYEAGFHIYEDDGEIKSKAGFRRVYYRNAHTRGRQDGKTVVVASDMYVSSDMEGWPPL